MDQIIETKSTETHNPVYMNLICAYKQDGGGAYDIVRSFDTSKINTNVMEIMDDKKNVLYRLSGKDNQTENRIYGSTSTHLNRNSGAQTSIYLITERNTNTPYVLKLTGLPNDRTDNYDLIRKYKEDLTIQDIKKNLIDIKFYGTIRVPTYEGSTCTFNYIIVPLYRTFDDPAQLTPLDRYNFLLKLAIFIQTLQSNNRILPDLKVQNIGFDDSKEIILIDYDVDAIYDSRRPLPGSGYTYRSSACVKIDNYNYYSFAMVVLAFFEIGFLENETNQTIWKCIFSDSNKRDNECNELKDIIKEVTDDLDKFDIEKCDNDFIYMAIIDECLSKNNLTYRRSFMTITHIIKKIIKKLNPPITPVDRLDTPLVSIGGNMYIKYERSYQLNKKQYYSLSA